MARNFDTITIPATAMRPAATNGAAFVSHNATYPRGSLAYDDTTGEVATTVNIIVPDAYTGTDTLKAVLLFYSASANSGTAAWAIECEAVTPGDTLDLGAAVSFDSANTGTVALSGTAGDLTALTVTLTNKDSAASGDIFRMAISRDVSADSVSGDLFLTSVGLYEET